MDLCEFFKQLLYSFFFHKTHYLFNSLRNVLRKNEEIEV